MCYNKKKIQIAFTFSTSNSQILGFLKGENSKSVGEVSTRGGTPNWEKIYCVCKMAYQNIKL